MINAPAERADTAGHPRYRYSLGLLTIIYVLNFVDRQIVNIVAEPIKAEFQLADWQLGAMTGLAFALLYTVFGFPLARWADRGDRPRIIGIAVLSWSAFTALCGLASNFTQFVIARLGVGLGEAGGTPPAHSLISDIAPAGKRASALAFYSTGAPLGQLVGLAMGGFVAAEWGWRSVFYVAGLPGLVLGVLAIFTIAEPRRSQVASTTETPLPFWPTLRSLSANRTFVLIASATAAASFVAFGLSAFYGSFFLRNHDDELRLIAARTGLMPISTIGFSLGLSAGIAGLAGSIIGGRIADAWLRSNKAAYVLLPAICLAIAMPLLLAALLVQHFWAAIALITAASLLTFAFTGVIFAAALGLVPTRSRATASASIILLINLVGFGLGPLCVGALSDVFAARYGSGTGIRLAMCCVTVAGWIAAYLFWKARRDIEADTIS